MNLKWLKRLIPTRQESAATRECAAKFYAQLIDDTKGVTLCSASTLDKDFEGNGGNKEAARKVGEKIAKIALEKGIEEVVFDRGGYIYHGRVQALADGAREGGLKF